MTDSLSRAEADELRGFVEEYEAARAEERILNDRKKEISKRAKDAGLRPKAVRHVVDIRAQDPEERKRKEEIVRSYLRAVEESETRSEQGELGASGSETHAGLPARKAGTDENEQEESLAEFDQGEPTPELEDCASDGPATEPWSYDSIDPDGEFSII